MSNKNAKKVVAPKPAKVAKPKKKIKKSNHIDGEAKLEFVSFRVRAVIPTQQYGNIQPEIEVKAPTYEMARDFVMPHIEALYKTYAERPINGNLPSFVGPVKVEEKVIVPPTDVRKNMENVPGKNAEVTSPEPATTTAPVKEPQLSDAGQKAKKMVDLAVTVEAVDLVEQKIKDSVKIPEGEKPVLYTLIIQKRKTF